MQHINRQWLLARRPTGMVQIEDFTFREAPVSQPRLEAGELLVRNLILSFDPAQRCWMDDVPSYLPPAPLGEPMRAVAVAQVLASADPRFPVGSLVQGMFGWQDYAIANDTPETAANPVPEGIPASMVLGLLGGSSLTAYFGLLDIGQPAAGDTVVVSGAAGAVGSMVVQIAKLKGCRVIGIAGGTEKCAWVRDACHADHVIDYQHEHVEQRLGELCPDGIQVYFDNVGGTILEAVIEHIADHGRIALCGAISTYNDATPQPGPRNLVNLVLRRVRMQGFITMDYMDRIQEAATELAGWAFSGQLQYREDIQEGFENIPQTFLRLFTGQNQGKQLLRLAEPAPQPANG